MVLQQSEEICLIQQLPEQVVQVQQHQFQAHQLREQVAAEAVQVVQVLPAVQAEVQVAKAVVIQLLKVVLLQQTQAAEAVVVPSQEVAAEVQAVQAL